MLVRRLELVTRERDKWLGAFNRSEQFQDGWMKRAEAAERRLEAIRQWAESAKDSDSIHELFAKKRVLDVSAKFTSPKEA